MIFSRFPAFLAVFAAASLLASFTSAGPLHAQWTANLPSPFATNAQRPDNVSEARVKDRYLWPDCPRGRYEYDVSYPRGMDAGGPVDVAVAELAQVYMTTAREEADAWYKSTVSGCSPELSRYAMTSTVKITSSPYRVSSSVYSVLFSWNTESGGAHGNYGNNTANFFTDGSPVTLGRLFPDPRRSLPQFWSLIFQGFCQGHETAPRYYGEPPCGERVPDVPEQLRNLSADLNDAGHLLLTSLGVSVLLGPYEAYSFAEGSRYGDIARDDLVNMGADPDIWR
jgi:hypothetical protein